MAYEDDYDISPEMDDWQVEWTSRTDSESESLSHSHQATHFWASDSVFRYHHEFFTEYNIPTPDTAERSRMTGGGVVPWLLTMSLLGLGGFSEPAAPSSQLSQDLVAPPLPQLQPIDFAMSSTTSFDDPSFSPEEPPHDCDFPSNHNHDNAAGHKHTKKPHGFQIDPNFATTQSSHAEIKKSERNIDAIQSLVNLNNIPTTTKSNNQPKHNESNKSSNSGTTFKTPKNSESVDEYVGPAMQLAYHWKTVDFEFDSEEDRRSLIYSGTFVPENNLPLGLEIWRDKIFISLPRWKKGIPATLATISTKSSSDSSPKLKAYPDWRWHHLGNCQGLTSVFRMQIDECDRLWVLDSGKIDITSDAKQICPPTIFVFDLYTDELIKTYQFPADQVKEDSLYTNIVVDARSDQCDRAVAYASDVWRFGLVVYDLFNDTSFRIQHHLFFPDPLSSRYSLHGIEFHWTDGLFGLAITPVDVNNEKTMFFHPMSSFREFAVPLAAIRDKRSAENSTASFVPVGQPRAKDYGHSSGSAIDRQGVMFFNMVTRDSVWCWDTRKEYAPRNLGVVGSSNVSLVFPNDIKVDHEEDQSVWVLSNRLPMYLYGHIKKDETNFRILRASVKEAVKNNVCDPNYLVTENVPSFDVTC